MDVLAASVRTWVERYHVTTPAADHDEPRRVQLAEAFVQQQRAIAEAVYAYAQKRARKMRSRANTEVRPLAPSWQRLATCQFSSLHRPLLQCSQRQCTALSAWRSLRRFGERAGGARSGAYRSAPLPALVQVSAALAEDPTMALISHGTLVCP